MNAAMRLFSRLLPVLLLLLLGATTLSAQPVINGHLVGTCYSGSNPGGYVVGLYNVTQTSLQPLNANWVPPMSHGPSNNWTAANLGEVFGVDFDAAGNIYVSASMVYNQYSPPNGPGGPGAIYRIDGVTGMITNFVTTLFAPCGTVVGTNKLPNDSVGLGNIAYDQANNQFFVTNFEDGKIYRINSAGIVQSAFDPFTPDGCTVGPAPLGERLWGINIYNGRVYFSRWVEDQGFGHYSSATANEIWSVGLNGSGDFTGSAVLEITLPALAPNAWSNPVSDIAFSASGKILLAERSMYGTANNPFYPTAHSSRLLEYQLVSGSWVPSSSVFAVGAYSVGNNSAGGCDYGYGSYDPIKRIPVDCDSTVWVSGDALHFAFNDYIYGWANLPASGGGAAQSVFVDADGDVTQVDKLQIGDLEVYKQCAPSQSNPCDKIRVTSKPVQSADGQVSCCFDLTVTGLTAGTFSSISAQLLTPSVSFTGVIGPTGWGVTNTGTYATWDSLGTIPGGTVTGLRFCLYSLASPPQSVEITFHGLDGTVCRDTLEFDCQKMPPPFPPCVTFGRQTLSCKESGPNGSVYALSFTVTNQSPFSLAPYNLPAENIIAYPVTPNITLTPSMVALSPTLGYGQTSAPLPFTISGTGAKPGDTVCIVVQLHGKKLQQDYQWCCPPDTLCFVLPPCKDCCDSVDIAIKPNVIRQVGNNAANISSSVTVMPGPVMSASATILGITRSPVWCPKKGSNGWIYVQSAAGGPMLGQIYNAAISPSLPLSSGLTPPSAGVSWGNVPAGVAMSGGSIGLQMNFPGSSLGWRCRDTLTICVRYTFTDTACRTCDTVVCYSLPRFGEIEIIAHDPKDLTPATLRNTNPVFSPSTGESTNPVVEKMEVDGPGLMLDMTSGGEGVLSVEHWWQDDFPGDPTIMLTRLHAQSIVRRDITAITEIGSGTQGRVVDRTAIIPIDLKKGETDQFRLLFENPDGARTFPVTIWFDYVSTTNTRDTLRSTTYIVYADLGDTARLHVRQLDKSTPLLMKFSVSAGDYDTAEGGPIRWMAPEALRFHAPQGVAILASGPMADSTSATFHFIRRIDKATPMLMKYVMPDDFEETSLPPGGVADLWLVLSGKAGTYELEWEGLNGSGDVMSTGTVTVDLSSSSVDDGVVTGSVVNLLQTWPNPVGDRINVRYRLATSQGIDLALFDATGRQVATLVRDDHRSSGSYETSLDTRGLPEGTYYLRMQTPNSTETRKLIIVR